MSPDERMLGEWPASCFQDGTGWAADTPPPLCSVGPSHTLRLASFWPKVPSECDDAHSLKKETKQIGSCVEYVYWAFCLDRRP